MRKREFHSQESANGEHSKAVAGRSILISLILGCLITLCASVMNGLHKLTYYAPRFPLDGVVLIDSNNNLAIRSLSDWRGLTQYSFVDEYQFRDRRYTAFGLVYPIVEGHRRRLLSTYGAAGQPLPLTPSQTTKVREQISIAFRTKGDFEMAEQVLLPDQKRYRIIWFGLAANILWIILTSALAWLVLEPIRLAIRRRIMENRRIHAVRADRCPNCGYDTRLLPQRRCPECGEVWEKCDEKRLGL